MSMAEQEAKRVQKVLQGRVVSDKMKKTIVVEIQQRKLHRLYKKYLQRTKRIKVHDENNDGKIGDTVRVVDSRPLSKDKRWRLLEIVERAK
jgi:small subunit ribosomal protein S17